VFHFRVSSQDKQIHYYECVDEHEGYCIQVSIQGLLDASSHKDGRQYWESGSFALAAGDRVESHVCVGEASLCVDMGTPFWLYALRIRVRTEETRLTSRAFMLASSRAPPNPVGSALVVQPTRDRLAKCE
jgi:hypothetical protein